MAQLIAVDDIQKAVIDRIEAASGLLPIKHDAMDFDHNGQPYAELMIWPNDTRSETIDGGDMLTGSIRINVYYRGGSGAKAPRKEGRKFLELFPRDLEFEGIRIPKTGTIRRPVDNEKGWDFTPVIINYEADSCQT